jgi:DNA (cytosine-5)-methyltransferase 1
MGDTPVNMDENNLTLIDLFAGCGGLALGFHNAGFETILANELHPDPAKTYQQNLLPNNPERMKIGDISKVMSNKEIDKMGLVEDDVTCIAGGPPCQGFSMAGAGVANDPRNRLYRDYLRVVRKISPETLVFENVPGFVNRYGLGLKDHLERSLEKMGYAITSGVVKASDYGVPQIRRRFICLGIKKQLIGEKKFDLPMPTWNTEMINLKLSTKQIIGDLDVYKKRGGYGTGDDFGPEKYLKSATSEFQKEMRKVSGVSTNGYTWNTKIPNHTTNVQERMAMFQKGLCREDLVGTKLETKKHSQRVLSADKPPNITIVSLPDDYVHYNRKMPRTLSVRECARFQTFPDDFVFYGKRTTGGLRRRIDVPQYTQVGNAIPPRLAEAIAQHLKSFID